MATAKIKLGLRGTKSVGKAPFTRWGASLLILALTILRVGGAAGGAETSTRTNQTNHASFQTALRDQMHADAELPRATHIEQKESGWHTILLSLEIGIGLALTFRLVVPRITKVLDKRMNPVSDIAAEAKIAVTEEKAVANFAAELQVEAIDTVNPDEQRKTIIEEFFAGAPGQLATLREHFAELNRSSETDARKKILVDFQQEIVSLKNRVGTLDLSPAWLLTSRIEILVEQLAQKPANITPSILRTVASGLLLLNDLCRPGVRKDLATEPPPRFLAVDDDLISRRAVSMSLKKVAQAPDLAEHGEAGLELARRQAYDAIFLDVEMPGLDGFEVCTKIHQLEPNRLAPVVFVTSHGDFESRARSASSGGSELIAKPFLSSEITLKAMALLLRGRLDREKAGRDIAAKGTPSLENNSRTSAVETDEKAADDAKTPAVADCQKESAPQKSLTAATAAQPEKTPMERKPPMAATKPKNISPSDLEQFAKTLRELKEQVSALNATENAELRQEFLNELYVGINLLRSDAARAGLRAVCELSSALGKLISKLLDKPTLHTPSTIGAISAAIQLLDELAQGGVEPDLVNPPVRALVVDDEPLARRAISNALQLTISKPDTAENGQAALALTQSKTFDVIFLDIMMPEVDGFETCLKIRRTNLNTATPIVFVTSSTDIQSRDKAFDCGGNGFISKPVLPAEIFLTALTYTLRARIGKGAPAEVLEEAVC